MSNASKIFDNRRETVNYVLSSRFSRVAKQVVKYCMMSGVDNLQSRSFFTRSLNLDEITKRNYDAIVITLKKGEEIEGKRICRDARTKTSQRISTITRWLKTDISDNLDSKFVVFLVIDEVSLHVYRNMPDQEDIEQHLFENHSAFFNKADSFFEVLELKTFRKHLKSNIDKALDSRDEESFLQATAKLKEFDDSLSPELKGEVLCEGIKVGD